MRFFLCGLLHRQIANQADKSPTFATFDLADAQRNRKQAAVSPLRADLTADADDSRFTGLEISKMTMFSSILILGMVVDGAIIVGEAIYHHLEGWMADAGRAVSVSARDALSRYGIAPEDVDDALGLLLAACDRRAPADPRPPLHTVEELVRYVASCPRSPAAQSGIGGGSTRAQPGR